MGTRTYAEPKNYGKESYLDLELFYVVLSKMKIIQVLIS